MTWARYDDALPFNRKVAWLRAHGERGIAALGLHLLANTWSRHEGMQGFIPTYIPEQLVGRTGDKLAVLLAEIEMFTETESGWMINDYEEYGDRDDGTPTTERIARISKVRSEAGRLGGLAKAGKRPSKPVSKPGSKRLAELQQTSSPVPEPVPVPKDVELIKGGQRTETLDPAETRCTAHQGISDPGNCRGCMNARIAAEKAIAKAMADAIERSKNCRRCGGTNFIEDADGRPVEKCSHLGSVAS